MPILQADQWLKKRAALSTEDPRKGRANQSTVSVTSGRKGRTLSPIERRPATGDPTASDPLPSQAGPSEGCMLRRRERAANYSRRVLPDFPSMDHLLSAWPMFPEASS